jgi:hypothetical protein
MSLRITFIGSINFLGFPTATGRRLQTPNFSSYNLREAPTRQFFGYNQKEATKSYVLRLQPAVLAPSNYPKIDVEFFLILESELVKCAPHGIFV